MRVCDARAFALQDAIYDIEIDLGKYTTAFSRNVLPQLVILCLLTLSLSPQHSNGDTTAVCILDFNVI